MAESSDTRWAWPMHLWTTIRTRLPTLSGISLRRAFRRYIGARRLNSIAAVSRRSTHRNNGIPRSSAHSGVGMALGKENDERIYRHSRNRVVPRAFRAGIAHARRP